MSCAPNTCCQSVLKVNECNKPFVWDHFWGWAVRCELIGESMTVKEGNVLQSKHMTWMESRQGKFFCPRTCLKTYQKTLWTLLSSASTGGIRLHTWREWKRHIHAFRVILWSWVPGGLINLFNQQLTGSLWLTWPFTGMRIGLLLIRVHLLIILGIK